MTDDRGPKEEEDFKVEALGPAISRADTHAISNTQAFFLLEKAVNDRATEQPGYVPHPVMKEMLAYTGRFKQFHTQSSAEEVANVLRGGFPELSGVQIAALANYMPEQADEAYTLLPSLRART